MLFSLCKIVKLISQEKQTDPLGNRENLHNLKTADSSFFNQFMCLNGKYKNSNDGLIYRSSSTLTIIYCMILNFDNTTKETFSLGVFDLCTSVYLLRMMNPFFAHDSAFHLLPYFTSH